MNTNKWKYNLSKHSVEEQPTMKLPDDLNEKYQISEFDFDYFKYDNDIDAWNKHLDSLRKIPVSAKVDWKDGEDVTGKFTIEKLLAGFPIIPHDFAIPIK